MEQITLANFEENFDSVLDDVCDLKVHYKIVNPNGVDFILMPAEDYNFLQETYLDWLDKNS